MNGTAVKTLFWDQQTGRRGALWVGGTVAKGHTFTIPEEILASTFFHNNSRIIYQHEKLTTCREIDQLRTPASSVPYGAKQLTKASSKSGGERNQNDHGLSSV